MKLQRFRKNFLLFQWNKIFRKKKENNGLCSVVVFKHFVSTTLHRTCRPKIKIINNLILIAQKLGQGNIKNEEDVIFFFISYKSNISIKTSTINRKSTLQLANIRLKNRFTLIIYNY